MPLYYFFSQISRHGNNCNFPGRSSAAEPAEAFLIIVVLGILHFALAWIALSMTAWKSVPLVGRAGRVQPACGPMNCDWPAANVLIFTSLA